MSTELYMLIGVVVFVVAFRLWWRAVDRRHARESAAQAAREHLTNLHARSDWDEVTWHRRRGGSQLPGPLDDAPKPPAQATRYVDWHEASRKSQSAPEPPAWTMRSPEEVWVEADRDNNMPAPQITSGGGGDFGGAGASASYDDSSSSSSSSCDSGSSSCDSSGSSSSGD